MKTPSEAPDTANDSTDSLVEAVMQQQSIKNPELPAKQARLIQRLKENLSVNRAPASRRKPATLSSPVYRLPPYGIDSLRHEMQADLLELQRRQAQRKLAEQAAGMN